MVKTKSQKVWQEKNPDKVKEYKDKYLSGKATVTVVVTPEQKMMLQEYCDREGKTFSEAFSDFVDSLGAVK